MVQHKQILGARQPVCLVEKKQSFKVGLSVIIVLCIPNYNLSHEIVKYKTAFFVINIYFLFLTDVNLEILSQVLVNTGALD